MKDYIRGFLSNETAAITVDWVVLVGFVVAIVLSVASALSPILYSRGANIVAPATVSPSF